MIVCNLCGKNIHVENGIPREDFLEVNKSWGYFSKKDGKTWKFVVCEECMDSFVKSFAVPYNEVDTTELV
ncbi:MAG: hypothetical protein J5962_03900 [Lachnospiraceae bacterium]|nr:hypothetical protein [Lachnospiraceae bacterium]